MRTYLFILYCPLKESLAGLAGKEAVMVAGDLGEEQEDKKEDEQISWSQAGEVG